MRGGLVIAQSIDRSFAIFLSSLQGSGSLGGSSTRSDLSGHLYGVINEFLSFGSELFSLLLSLLGCGNLIRCCLHCFCGLLLSLNSLLLGVSGSLDSSVLIICLLHVRLNCLDSISVGLLSIDFCLSCFTFLGYSFLGGFNCIISLLVEVLYFVDCTFNIFPLICDFSVDRCFNALEWVWNGLLCMYLDVSICRRRWKLMTSYMTS